MLALAAALLMPLAGCGPEGAGADPRENWISYEEMLDYPGGTFVERDGSYLCIASDAEEGHWSGAYRWDRLASGDISAACYRFKGSEDPTVPLFSFEEGDVIVSTEEDNAIGFDSIEDFGYCKLNQNPYQMPWEEAVRGDCVFSGTVTTDYDEVLLMEIDGQEFRDEISSASYLSTTADNARKILASKGVKTSGGDDDGFYYAPEPVTIEAGYYEGTKWIDAPIVFDVPFVSTQEKYASYAEKTKEGYFVFDVPEVDPGEYIMNAGSGCYRVVVE